MKTLYVLVAALAVLTATMCVPATAMASNNADVMAVVAKAVGSFNKDDAKTWEAQCAPSTYIISNIAPYQYSTTCADWWSAHAVADKKAGVSDEIVTLETPWHVETTGDRAYVAVPANFTYKQKGKTIKTVGNVLTVTLQKAASGWLMTGWAWSQR